jgi:methylmalonyl-CoA mutase N-terminal domain/subunit
VARALEDVRRAAAAGDNVMPVVMEAVKAYATVGEIMAALKAELGTFEEPVRF